MTPLYAWHFIRADGLLRDGTPSVVGAEETVSGDLILCQHGLHGSERLIDALRYAPGPILRRCRYGGKIVRGDDKFVSSVRTPLWQADVSGVLWLGACHFTETAMALMGWTDERSWAAIETRRRWLRGEATEAELAAAASAAFAAVDAGNAAWDAARVARNAAGNAAGAARNAAGDAWVAAGVARNAGGAARNAAWAAWNAGGAAAWAAWAGGAASGAAWAARAAAVADQNDWLECAVRELTAEPATTGGTQ